MSQIETIVKTIHTSTDPVIVFSKNAIIFLLLFLAIRYLLTGYLFRSAKKIDKQLNKTLRRYYFHHSWVGWIFFLIALTVYEMLLFKGELLFAYASFESWILIIGLLVILAIFSHVYFFTRELLNLLKQRVEIESN